MFECFLSTFAYLTMLYIFYRIIFGAYIIIYPYLIATPLDLHKLTGGANWAIVTGSTDGIGKAYATELGKKGFNLILIARNASKLQSVKEEILDECKNNSSSIEVKTIIFDFSNANLEDYKKEILPEIEKKEIGILVNKARLVNDFPDHLHSTDDLQRNADIAIVNTLPASILTAAVLPQMTKRNSGIIINFSSSAAFMQIPYLSIYSASRVYTKHLSNILTSEYANYSGIIIQTLYPLNVATKISKCKERLFFVPSPKKYAQSAIKTIGIISETTGYLGHQIQAMLIFSIVPEFLLTALQKKLQKAESEREKMEILNKKTN